MLQADHRRRLLKHAIVLGSSAAVASVTQLVAAEGEPGKGGRKHGHAHAFRMPASTENKCGTCVFWGGERAVTRDMSEVHVLSLGMCNNPASPNYHTTTSPETGPMKFWVKWPALG